ncbi:unnamed protein product [Victoria cruziana]
MSHRGRPRKEGTSAPDPPRGLAREDREDRETVQDHQFQMIMASIQALSETIGRQQVPQLQHVALDPEATVVPPLPPAAPEIVPIPEAVPVEPAEPAGITPTAAQYKAFMSTKPPRFTSREGADKAEEWLEEIEKAFDIMDTPVRHWVRFGTFLLVEDAKAWWKTVLDIRFGGQQPTWEEFAAQFRETYVPQVARERRVREFLELAQSGRSVADYAARFRHLQRYSPHLFGLERERANRFVWGLDEGLRPRVMSSNPSTLLLAVEMATRMEEDYHRSQVFAKRQKDLAPAASQFKKASSASKMSRPPLAGPTASQKLPPSRPRVCYHCNQAGHL